MQVVYRRCWGLDVHKDSVVATVLVFPDKGEREVRTQQFGTHWKELQRLAQWLQFKGGEGRDGVYGRVLEAGVECARRELVAGAGQPISGQEHSEPEDGPQR